MSTFADSSALVKLYADEAGHAVVRGISGLVVSQLARVEVPAAIWRKHRMGELSAGAAAVLVGQFEADWFGTATEPSYFAIVRITGSTFEAAARLTGIHGLRAYDAVQLAAALEVRSAVPTLADFAAFDVTLRAAAAAEGFTLVPAD